MAITIVPEDGTFPADANSYVSLAEANTYHSNRGNVDWSDADTADRLAALVRATYALETLYKNKWNGVKTQSWEDADGNPATPKQVLAWPRVEEADETDPVLLRDVDGIKIAATEIPTQVKHAQMEIALIELSSRVVGSVVSEQENVKRVTVGPITQEFFESAPSIDQYPHIDMILAGLVPAGGAYSGIAVTIGLTAEEANQSKTSWDDTLSDSRWFHQA